jgi:Ca2+/Na+ antiporter
MVIGVAIAAFVVIEVIAHIVLYLRFPKEARTPKDEREHLIDLRATRLAAYVYVAGTFLAILTPHHGASGFAVGVFVLFAFAVAEFVKYAARIIYYRRGF